MTKPFHADEVLARVRTHITNKRLREELESHNMLIGMELHEKSRQLETLMNNLPGLAYQGEHSPDRKVRFVSQGVTRLTGYTPEKLARLEQSDVSYGDFFRSAPAMNPNRILITGKICGVQVETIEDPLMRDIRYLDKLVDELAKGKAMEKILRKQIPDDE